MNKKYYITTAIPYVNARPHIGFALELVQTDAIARYRRQQGDDTFFLTGTDDNSLKNVQAAENEGKETKAFVDENAAVFKELTERLNISQDSFIRTASDEHFNGAKKLWATCKPEDIYKKKYQGLYCVGCEQFYTEKELLDDGTCPEHKTKPEVVEEENYFFKLTNYQKQLEELIESDTYRVVPQSRKNEILSFIRSGLEDFSISRSVARAKGWGVPVPGDDEQIMYVWFDALSNYLTGLGYGNDEALFTKYWLENEHRVHIIGKGIIRFHAVYWPAMLLSAGIPLPKELFVHGYINVDGGKMSKSLGNVVDPFDLVERFGVEAVRFYLLKHIHPFEDSDFSEERFIDMYNADLANGLGNLVSRVTNMVEKYFNGKLEATRDEKIWKEVSEHLDAFDYKRALESIWKVISESNQLIDEKKPWELAKADEASLKTVLETLLGNLHAVTNAVRPFLPETADTIEQLLAADRIVKAEPLFKKIS